MRSCRRGSNSELHTPESAALAAATPPRGHRLLYEGLTSNYNIFGNRFWGQKCGDEAGLGAVGLDKGGDLSKGAEKSCEETGIVWGCPTSNSMASGASMTIEQE